MNSVDYAGLQQSPVLGTFRFHLWVILALPTTFLFQRQDYLSLGYFFSRMSFSKSFCFRRGAKQYSIRPQCLKCNIYYETACKYGFVNLWWALFVVFICYCTCWAYDWYERYTSKQAIVRTRILQLIPKRYVYDYCPRIH